MIINKALFCSAVVATGGFLFGYGTAVISDAEQSMQPFGSLNPFAHGLPISIVFASFFTQYFAGWDVTIYLRMCVAFFSFSLAAVIWFFIAGVFLNPVGAKSQTPGSFTHWVMAAIIVFSFPALRKKLAEGALFCSSA